MELIGGVIGPWRAGDAALCVVQRVSSSGMGVGGFSSSDWERRMLIADSSTYLLRNACAGTVTNELQYPRREVMVDKLELLGI